MPDLFQAHRERVGRRIREARLAAHMSHDQLGARVGTSRQHLIKLEKGMHAPRPEMLAAIAEATGRGQAWFTSEDDDEDSSIPMTAEQEFLAALTRPFRTIDALSARVSDLETRLALAEGRP